MRGDMFRSLIPSMPLVFKLAKLNHWQDAWSWLGYTMLGGLLPFWGTWLLLIIISKSQPFGAYFENGELAVFSAGLIATAFPLMQRRVKDAPIEHPAYLNFLAILILAVALLLFGSLTITRQIPAAGANPFVIDHSAVLRVSILLFAASLLLGFIAELTNNVRLTSEELQAIDAQRETSLADKFEQAKAQEAAQPEAPAAPAAPPDVVPEPPPPAPQNGAH